jgi:eukaryotic-like serine/threonine-protein kinase
VGKLDHPHIVRALDAGEEGGTYFLAMEYLDGCDLGHLLKTKGPLEVPHACELIRQAALGLQYAHDHHLVHRDVKPSNLMLSSAGQVKVLDLGLAQLQVQLEEPDELTREGQMVGTWLYMAPEQILPGRQVDSRSDIFSLGVTFYSFLAGTLPITRGQVTTQLPSIGTQREDVPPEVQELLSKMLAPSQEERIQSMTEVANILQAYTSQDPVNILANDASRYARTVDLPNSIDATARFSTTAHDVEVIPPPLPVEPPPIALPAAPLKDWLLRYWQHVGLGAVAVAAALMLVVILNWPDAEPDPNQALSTPRREAFMPPVIEKG